jgi:hypothetical protein
MTKSVNPKTGSLLILINLDQSKQLEAATKIMKPTFSSGTNSKFILLKSIVTSNLSVGLD